MAWQSDDVRSTEAPLLGTRLIREPEVGDNAGRAELGDSARTALGLTELFGESVIPECQCVPAREFGDEDRPIVITPAAAFLNLASGSPDTMMPGSSRSFGWLL